MRRRDLLAVLGTAGTGGLAGCSSLIASEEPAHSVSVYLVDSEVARDVTVTVTEEDGTTLFEEEHGLSETNEADENVPFPASGDPEGIVVTIDGTRFERDWPGFEQPELPCDDPNHAGIEIWIENGEDGSPEIRVEANCQSVTMDG